MKKAGIFLWVLLLVVLSGCSNYEDLGKNIIQIKKNGTIEETVQESFEEDYYTQEELLSSIEAEVASYNQDAESALVELKECAVEEGLAKVQMNYASSKDYAAFNHVGVFHGTISEFVESEYHSYVDMKDMDGNEIPMSSLIASGEEYYVVVLDIDCILELKGTISYISDGVETLSKKAADVTLGDEAAYAYIVYK